MLGFDTALAAGLPDGMIVPGETWADPQYMGLRGDYYSGIDFQTYVLSRTDPNVDFDSEIDSPDPLFIADYFSVRWTGQIQPRYSERYTFHVRTDDGVRLWVDGILIINQWIDQPPTEHSSTISLALEAERWYSIQLEYYEKTGVSTIKLYWSSRSETKEIIPQSRLYSVRDETARLELPPSESAAGTSFVVAPSGAERAESVESSNHPRGLPYPQDRMTKSNTTNLLVGQTVVGESGPLAKADFGMPLFSETAHLFTVTVPAGALPETAQRDRLRQVIEAEKPAHTDFHLCFVEAKMRVGFQARLGIDSIVAGPPEPMALSDTTLGLDSYLAPDEENKVGRVGKRARLGRDTIIG
jgi:hypothetical protein